MAARATRAPSTRAATVHGSVCVTQVDRVPAVLAACHFDALLQEGFGLHQEERQVRLLLQM